MHRRPALVSVSLIACAALVAGGASAGERGFGGSGGSYPQVGVSGHPDARAADFERMRRYNVGVYRFALSMRTIDRQEAGIYTWNQIDRLIGAAARHGIRLQPILHRALRHAPDPPSSVAERRRWRHFVAGAVQRYGPRGQYWMLNPLTPRMPITAWQVWNEPNLAYYWDGDPDPAEYVDLLADTAATIRRVDPGATVILAGLNSSPSGRRAPGLFLRRLYRHGAAPHFDVAAIHPYARTISGSKRHILQLHRAIERAGHAPTPIWVTEVGWSTAGKRLDHFLITDVQGQARRLRRIYLTANLLRRRVPLGQMLWYSWQDSTETAACGWCEGTGLIRENGTAKRSAAEFAVAALLD